MNPDSPAATAANSVGAGLTLALGATLAAACLPEVDTGVTNGPLLSFVGEAGVAGDGGGSNKTRSDPPTSFTDADTLPSPFTDADLQVALTEQCEAGSELCYQLCGSPSCALVDNTIPGELATPPVLLPEGGTTQDSCADVNALAYQIRQHSCSQCHGPPPAPGFDGLNFILDDESLVTKVPQVVMTPVVIAGNPYGSLLFQRVQQGLVQGSQQGMPPPSSLASNLAGASIAASIVYPTSEDLSILYAWILNCVPGADGGAYSTSYYGGDYGPNADGGASATVTSDAGED